MERKARVKSLPRKNKVDEIQVYCRKCMKMKVAGKDVYQSVDLTLDKNGYMSICKECCQEIYENSYAIEHSLEKALLRTCKILNVGWIANAVDATRNHIDKGRAKGQEDFSVFGIYKSKLSTLANLSGDQALTFEEYPVIESVKNNTPEQEENQTYQELQSFWGKGKSYEDISYLQNEFNELGGATAIDDRPKAILLREICFQLLEIEKDRLANKDVEKRVKALGEMMSNSAIRPDQKKVADGNKSSEAFGVWLADIEKYKPAEWYKNQDIYKDVNGIKEYWDTHILRPFLNFWGIQKNMNFPGAVEREDSFDDFLPETSEE
jgi:hypothetical protein